MRTLLASLLALCALVATCGTATAQEKGQTGIAMGYPTSVSLVWHATDRFALKPEVTFSATSTENSSSQLGLVSKSTSDAVAIGFAVNALFYLNKSDGLSTYLAPRVGYTHSSVESEAQSSFAGTRAGETTSTTVNFSGSFGAQYSLTRRFSVFGEVGISYSDVHSESNIAVGASDGWGVAMRSAAGVILYF